MFKTYLFYGHILDDRQLKGDDIRKRYKVTSIVNIIYSLYIIEIKHNK